MHLPQLKEGEARGGQRGTGSRSAPSRNLVRPAGFSNETSLPSSLIAFSSPLSYRITWKSIALQLVPLCSHARCPVEGSWGPRSNQPPSPHALASFPLRRAYAKIRPAGEPPSHRPARSPFLFIWWLLFEERNLPVPSSALFLSVGHSRLVLSLLEPMVSFIGDLTRNDCYPARSQIPLHVLCSVFIALFWVIAQLMFTVSRSMSLARRPSLAPFFVVCPKYPGMALACAYAADLLVHLFMNLLIAF